ncbi:MAG: acyltransferase [Verrucomicrobiota bacterium]
MLSLSQKIEGTKEDNLNLVRLFLAIAVIFSHSFALILGGDKDEPLNRWTHDVTFGTVAVCGFFFISGFLITGSWQRSKSFFDFSIKRVLRIYPGFIVALMFCAALIWLICPEFKNFIASNHLTGQWIKIAGHDALFLKSECISDLNAFAHNPRPGLTNSPLWTIPIEFTCYLAVLVAGLGFILRSRWLVLILTGLGYQFCIMSLQQYNTRSDQFYLCFAFGAVAWLWKDRIPFSSWLAALSLATLLAASHFRPWFSIAFPLAGGYCLLWLAYAPKLALARWTNKTDLSYGTYLYACPIQQTLISHMTTYSLLQWPLVNFILTLPLTLLLAFASWTVIEKPCLSLKRLGRKNRHQPVESQPVAAITTAA